MKLDIASLGIGAAAGVAIVTAAVVIFVLQPGKVVLDNEPAMAAIVANNGTHFYLSGLVTEMSEDIMILDQTFGRPDFNDNPRVTVRLDWAAFCKLCGAPVRLEKNAEIAFLADWVRSPCICARLPVCMTENFMQERYGLIVVVDHSLERIPVSEKMDQCSRLHLERASTEGRGGTKFISRVKRITSEGEP